jgi:transposase
MAPHAQVIRAKIVLFAGGGTPNNAIAERLDVHVDVVSRWRQRFCTQGLAGLVDRGRSGRPRIFAGTVVAGSRRWPANRRRSARYRSRAGAR